MGDAAHDGGVAFLRDRGVFPDLQVVDANDPATRLRALAASRRPLM
jgi:hypothetical protein